MCLCAIKKYLFASLTLLFGQKEGVWPVKYAPVIQKVLFWGTLNIWDI